MIELLTAAQMRAIEQTAIASGEVTGLELMERAGRGVVDAIFEEWPELRATSHRAVVLCGPGNNGGDGFVVARLLQEWGWEVEVFLYGDPERMPPDARVNHARWLGMGKVIPLSGLDWPILRAAAVCIDAVFGIGLTRPIPPAVWGSLAMAQESGARLVAVDILSGICADSGRVVSDSGFTDFPAALTVTFERPKTGHVLSEGAVLSGRVRVSSIGLERQMDALLAGPQSDLVVDATVPSVSRLGKAEGHKYDHGHVLVLSGPSGRGGAARLAARGALRTGAGVVTVGCPLDAIPENAARLDAVMLRGVADATALAGVLEDQRINALCLGPGMGTGAREEGLVAVALGLPAGGPPPPSPPHQGEGSRLGPGTTRDDQALPLPLVGRGEGWGVLSLDRLKVVLDADALTILSHHPDLFAALHEGCVLTPHAGEFARLFPDIAAKLTAPATKGPACSKVDATREAATRAGCVVLYKGPDTVIADPSGRCAVNSAHYDREAPWLATAGSGDVLAGFITGLLARGFSPFDAACTGAWLHVECARSFGPGLIAEDLPEELPKVFRALGTRFPPASD
jgi:hydroxyethylthiazole kinase-like uncharacterized protein yjeF